MGEKQDRIYDLTVERFTGKGGCVAFVEAGNYDSLVPHGHDFIEAAYVAEGFGIHKADGREIPVKKGDVFVLADWACVHSVVPDPSCGDFRLYNLVIPYGMFQVNLSHVKPWNVFSEEEIPPLGELFRVARAEYAEKRFGYHPIVDAAALCVLHLIVRFRKEKETTFPRERFDGDYVEIAKDYITRNFAFPLTVADVADVCCVSPVYLQELFKKKSSLSVKQFLLNERLRHSCYRLLGTDFSVEEVARSCGFTDMKYFYSCFKKFFKTTPDGYRRKYAGSSSESVQR